MLDRQEQSNVTTRITVRHLSVAAGVPNTLTVARSPGAQGERVANAPVLSSQGHTAPLPPDSPPSCTEALSTSQQGRRGHGAGSVCCNVAGLCLDSLVRIQHLPHPQFSSIRRACLEGAQVDDPLEENGLWSRG